MGSISYTNETRLSVATIKEADVDDLGLIVETANERSKFSLLRQSLATVLNLPKWKIGC